MTYVLSDIHGCYELYKKMLEKIDFRDEDILYVIGDVVDRGPEPIEVLWDMSMRHNVIPILGNHDFIAHQILGQLLMELTEENLKKHFGGKIDNFLLDVASWEDMGGDTTIRGFGKLPFDKRADVIEYLSEFSLYEKISVCGQKYILTHIGIPDGATPDNLDGFDAYDFIGPEIDTNYRKVYFEDTILVTGHLPTATISKEYRGRIYRKNNHIAIDVGAVFGFGMGCVCLDTGEEFYE